MPATPSPTTTTLKLARVSALAAAALASSLLAPSAFAAKDASFVSLDVGYANMYIAEGFVEFDDPSYSAALSLSVPLFPFYLEYGTLRSSDSQHEDEIAMGFDIELLDNYLDIGLAYIYGNYSEEVQILDSKGKVTGMRDVIAFDDGGEAYISFSSAEFFYLSLSVHYTYNMVSEGGLFGFGIDFNYDITDILYLGVGLLGEIEQGYLDIDGLDGLYHIDYSLLFGAGLGDIISAEIGLDFIVPNGNGKDHGVTEELVFWLGFSFAF